MMNKKVFFDTEELAEYLVECDKVDKQVEVILFADRAEELLRYFLSTKDFVKIGILEFENCEFDYCDEYSLSLCDGRLSICRARHEPTEEWPDKFYHIIADEALLDGDVDSAVIGYCYSKNVYELEFTSELEEDEACDYVECECPNCGASLDPYCCSLDEFIDDLVDILDYFF